MALQPWVSPKGNRRKPRETKGTQRTPRETKITKGNGNQWKPRETKGNQTDSTYSSGCTFFDTPSFFSFARGARRRPSRVCGAWCRGHGSGARSHRRTWRWWSKPWWIPFWQNTNQFGGSQLRETCGSKTNGTPFWLVGEFATHFRTFSWDVHWGYDLAFDPWPHGVCALTCWWRVRG